MMLQKKNPSQVKTWTGTKSSAVPPTFRHITSNNGKPLSK